MRHGVFPGPVETGTEGSVLFAHRGAVLWREIPPGCAARPDQAPRAVLLFACRGMSFVIGYVPDGNGASRVGYRRPVLAVSRTGGRAA